MQPTNNLVIVFGVCLKISCPNFTAAKKCNFNDQYRSSGHTSSANQEPQKMLRNNTDIIGNENKKQTCKK